MARPFRVAVAIGLAVLAPACPAKKAKRMPEPPSVSARPGEVLGPRPPTEVPRWPAGAFYDPDPSHPRNRLHRALYGRRVEASVARCLPMIDGGGCLAAAPMNPLGGPVEQRAIESGGDDIAEFMGKDLEFLLEPIRARELEAACLAVARLPSSDNPTAAVLLQNDVWERFDSTFERAREKPEQAEGFARLRARLAETIKALALPVETIRAIPSNFAGVGLAHEAQLPGFANGEGWVEIRQRFTERRDPDEPWRTGTRHARSFGYRMVFRVLVRVPASAGGADWLRAELAKNERIVTPPGSLLALVASPLAIATAGEIAAIPLVVLVELRTARDPNATVATIADAAFEVFEGRRRLLSISPRPFAGLERLAPDAPIPLGATCSPSPRMIAPLRTTCATCHGLHGAALTGPMTHGSVRFEEERDPHAAARIVIEEKNTKADFKELRAALLAASVPR